MEIDKSFVLTDDVIDNLLDDWLERDGETFLKIRKHDRLGWEKTIKEGESYSTYLLESPTHEDLIKRAYSLARDMITSMDFPFSVKVKIVADDTSGYTDGKVVCVSTKMFDDPELSVGEKLDTFLGLVIHEGCHLAYTDFNSVSAFRRKSIEHWNSIFQIFNILEDERIEELCGEEKPGLANFLEKSKYYYFDQYYLDYVAKDEKSLTPYERLLNLILRIVRYPKYLKEEEVIEFAYYLIEVKKVLVSYPSTTEETLSAAIRVFEIIKEFYKDIERDKKKESDGLGGDGEGDDSADKDAEKSLTTDVGRASESIDKLLKGHCSISDSGEKIGAALTEGDVSAEVKEKGRIIEDICEGKIELGSSRHSFFLKQENAEKIYRESANRVRRYVPAISKILRSHCRDYKLIHHSMRSGVLDTGKLPEAFQGVPSVYMREGEVKTDRVSVCVLIDESGSMCGTRINSARDTAVLINEAIGKIPNVDLFIYGHSGDNLDIDSTDLYVYREKGYAPKYSLGSIKARYQNRDGVAICEVAKRVRKQTKDNVLMFVLSDGAPCAGGYYGNAAMEHVRKCVTDVEKMGFYVVQVCIEHSYDPSKMFKNYVILENMSTLASDLSKIIKKSAMDAAKIRVV